MLTNHISRLAQNLTLCFTLLLLQSACTADNTPRVVVSIKPVHSLLSHITAGTEEPALLIDSPQSAHHFQLRPSQKRLLDQADLFIYSSDAIEGFVDNLKSTSGELEFIELAMIPDLKKLPIRRFNSPLHNDEDSHNEEDRQSDGDHAHGHQADFDGHIWLSIDNAKVIATYLTQRLSKLSPSHSEQYQLNLETLVKRLDKLKQNNQQLLANQKQQPFLVYHDAFQYFEQENQLQGAHFVTTSPEHKPGIKRVRELRKLIQQKQINCVFYEPPNIPPLIKVLSEGNLIKPAQLDPGGLLIPAGKQHYFDLLSQTAQTISKCLNTPKSKYP